MRLPPRAMNRPMDVRRPATTMTSAYADSAACCYTNIAAARLIPSLPCRGSESEPILEHQDNHPHAQLERFPQVAGDRRFADSTAVVDRDLNKRNLVRDDFHQQLRSEMRTSDG